MRLRAATHMESMRERRAFGSSFEVERFAFGGIVHSQQAIMFTNLPCSTVAFASQEECRHLGQQTHLAGPVAFKEGIKEGETGLF